MARIVRTPTGLALVTRVAALLDTTITSTTQPSTSQVLQWLNEGSLLLAQLLPEHRLGSMCTTLDQSDVGATMDLGSTTVLRVLSAKKYGKDCVYRQPQLFDRIKSRMPILHTSRSPMFTYSGSATGVKVDFYPESSGDVSLRVVMRPDAYDSSDPWTPGDWAPPVEWETQIVEYAVIQGRVQDEEPEQAELYMKQWMQMTGLLTNVPILGSEGST